MFAPYREILADSPYRGMRRLRPPRSKQPPRPPAGRRVVAFTAWRSPTARRRRYLLRAAAALSLAMVTALAVYGCQRRLRPPPSSPKPGTYRPAAVSPTPMAPRTATLQPPPPAPKDEVPDPVAERGVRIAPPAPTPPKPPPGPAYDAATPCFTAAQMTQARAVLFEEDPGRWGDRWMHAINGAFHDLGITCADDGFLVLVLTTIQLESGVTVDPALENPDLEALFTFQMDELRRDNPIARRALNYSGLDEAMREKLRADTRRGHVRTEGDLVDYVEKELRTWLQSYLERTYYLPEGVARYAAEQGLPNPVNTIGPMQVNLRKAYENARTRGEQVESERQMRDWLLNRRTAMERGIKEGVYQLWRIYRFYRRYLPADQAVRYTTADFNAGEFSSRNAAFQARVAELTGRTLVLDGDLLVYQAGRPAERVSNTEAAVITLLDQYAAPHIRRDLLLEKTAAFSLSRTARMVCSRYRRATRKPCAIATVPAGATNAVARVKLGRNYTPANYARAYVQRWTDNLERYGAG